MVRSDRGEVSGDRLLSALRYTWGIPRLALMTARYPRYSKAEFVRRGTELYETQIRSQVEAGNRGKLVAIDIETGAFEVADTAIAACDRLYEQHPDAQPWVIRIGHDAVYRFGSRSFKRSP